MNTLNGYAKSTLTNDYLLTAAGGHKSLSDFLLKSGGTMTGALTVPSISVTGAATFSQAINGSILGNAATASRLLNTRTITIGSKSNTFDGSGDISFTLALIGVANNVTSHLRVGASGGNANATSATSDPYLLLVEGSTYDSQVLLKGNGKTTISANNGIVTISSTWRGIQDNLTSTSTTDSLSAALGKALNDKFVNYLYTALVLASQDNITWAQGIAKDHRRAFYYNTSGVEWSYLFGFSSSSNANGDVLYGAVLKMGYTDKYLRILRVAAGTWLSADWEKISAGYADTAGSVTNGVYTTGNQTISGNKTFSSSVTIDDLTAGNLVVSGNASFSLIINGSINGSAVQLLNSRSLWGNSFNGTADIDDSITLANNKCIYIKNSSSLSKNVLQLTSSDVLKVGYGSGIAGHNTEISGGTIYLKTNTTNTTALTLDSNLHSIFGGNIILKNDSIISFKDTSNTNRNALTLSTSNNLAIGYGTSGAGYNTYLDGNNIYMRVGTSHTTALTIDANGLFTFEASLYNEATTLAETSADLNLNNSNIKGINGIYFSDISNEINEGIHFVRSGNNVDTLTSYEGVLYYRTNRALGTTKSDASTLSSNVILHNGNISNYQRYHNTYYTTSSNGTAGTSSIASTLNASTYTGYVNGYWLGNLDYSGAMCTSDMANASNTGKYNFVKTGDADTFIYDSSTTVQLIIGSRGTNEIIDIYNLQGATLRIFVVNTYNDTRCSVYVIDGDSRTIFDGEDYSTSIAGNVKYWKYNSASYTQLTGISTYFLSNTRGILRVIWESEGRIFLIKCSAFPN